MTQTTYLAHHGVKGMKWGVRHEKERSQRIAAKNADKARLRQRVSSISSDSSTGGFEKFRRWGNAQNQYVYDRRVSKSRTKLQKAKASGKARKINRAKKSLDYAKASQKVMNKRVSDSNKGYDRASKGERAVTALLSVGNSSTYYAHRGRGESAVKAGLHQMGSNALRVGNTNLQLVGTAASVDYNARKDLKNKKK